jgi:hypothetical protein
VELRSRRRWAEWHRELEAGASRELNSRGDGESGEQSIQDDLEITPSLLPIAQR